ncbi:hypothetical protein CHARACLAT_023257 [Characodon lateralis]|uniref:Transmembrane protein n=1 Tax=Characodon lateralis TaxID=208331 RepID=A0ABU7DCY4_9TELE|nr:hypothetical protein [Characodon lateralis]
MWSHSGSGLSATFELFQSRQACYACFFQSKKTLSICSGTLQTRSLTYCGSSAPAGPVSLLLSPPLVAERKMDAGWRNKVVKFVFYPPPLPSFTKLHFLSPCFSSARLGSARLRAVGGHIERQKEREGGPLFARDLFCFVFLRFSFLLHHPQTDTTPNPRGGNGA